MFLQDEEINSLLQLFKINPVEKLCCRLNLLIEWTLQSLGAIRLLMLRDLTKCAIEKATVVTKENFLQYSHFEALENIKNEFIKVITDTITGTLSTSSYNKASCTNCISHHFLNVSLPLFTSCQKDHFLTSNPDAYEGDDEDINNVIKMALPHFDFDEENLLPIIELMEISLSSIRAICTLYLRDFQDHNTSCCRSCVFSDENTRPVSFRVFIFAVKRILAGMAIQPPHNVDPSFSLVDSFPDAEKCLGSGWMALMWALLGDPANPNYYNNEDLESDQINPKVDECNSTEYLLTIKALILCSATISEETDKGGRRALHYAARMYSPEIVRVVLEANTSANGLVNNSGALPFHNACQYTSSIPILDLLSSKNHLNVFECYNNNGAYPLHISAAYNKNLSVVQYLFNKYPEAIKIKDRKGFLPLHYAAQNDDVSIVHFIYSTYPEAILVPSAGGGLPLHHAACFSRSVDIITYLYDHFPPSIKIRDSDGALPLHTASYKANSPDVIRFLLETYPESAAQSNNYCRIPLHILISNKNFTASRVECLRLLLSAYPLGVSDEDSGGDSPYDLADDLSLGNTVMSMLLHANPLHAPQILWEKTIEVMNWKSILRRHELLGGATRRLFGP